MGLSGIRYVNLRNSDGSLEVGTLTNPLRVDPTGATPLTVSFAAPSASTVASVSASASSVSLLAVNASRKGAFVYNDSVEQLYLKLGTTASATSFTVLIGPSGLFEVPFPVYTGAIDGIWTAAAGTARITELT